MTGALRLATRGSPLAVAQATAVAARLEALGIRAELVVVDTEGDRRGDVALSELAGQGVFVKEVQAAVLDGRADVAVHSAKDLPALTPEGLVLASVPERLDPADALVGKPLQVLGPGATVATGAPRRRALLLAERPDLSVVPLRGNIARRVAAVGTNDVEAVVVAVAALLRLGLDDRIAERLDTDRFVPQVGQGAIALECVADSDAHRSVERLDDPTAHRALLAERSFLRSLGAGCDLPGGALATCERDTITLRAVLMTEDGAHVVRGTETGSDPEVVGHSLGTRLQRDLDGQLGAT